MHWLRSVRFRLTLTVVVVFGLAAAGASVMLLASVESSLVDDVRARDEALLASVERQVREGRPPEGGSPFFGVDENGEITASARPGGPLVLFAGDGAPALLGDDRAGGQGPPGQRPPPGRPPDPDRRHQDGPPAVFDPDTNEFVDAQSLGIDDDYELSEVTVSTDEGEVTVLAASPLADVRRSVDAMNDALWLAVPLMVVVVGLIAWLVTGRALRPVSAITGRVEEITDSTLHERVPVPRSGDEIARLAGTMNDMLDRLDSAAQRQRRFVSDASHELRTPVAAIRTELEVALLQRDDADWESVARDVLTEDERMERVVGELLALARLSEAPVDDRPVYTDIDDVVLAEASRARPVGVDVSEVSAVRVRGRPEQYRQVVGHLLDNACRHAGAEVRVSVSKEGDGVRVVVEDDGPGISESDREVVFDRFVRLDEGRSRDAGGAGLGLAVVRETVAGLGGTVRVDAGALGGARFTVDLPNHEIA